jgi:hypothetical protein
MANKIKVKRGLKKTMPTSVEDGELRYSKDTGELFISSNNKAFVGGVGNERLAASSVSGANIGGLTGAQLKEKIEALCGRSLFGQVALNLTNPDEEVTVNNIADIKGTLRVGGNKIICNFIYDCTDIHLHNADIFELRNTILSCSICTITGRIYSTPWTNSQVTIYTELKLISNLYLYNSTLRIKSKLTWSSGIVLTGDESSILVLEPGLTVVGGDDLSSLLSSFSGQIIDMRDTSKPNYSNRDDLTYAVIDATGSFYLRDYFLGVGKNSKRVKYVIRRNNISNIHDRPRMVSFSEDLFIEHRGDKLIIWSTINNGTIGYYEAILPTDPTDPLIWEKSENSIIFSYDVVAGDTDADLQKITRERLNYRRLSTGAFSTLNLDQLDASFGTGIIALENIRGGTLTIGASFYPVSFHIIDCSARIEFHDTIISSLEIERSSDVSFDDVKFMGGTGAIIATKSNIEILSAKKGTTDFTVNATYCTIKYGHHTFEESGELSAYESVISMDSTCTYNYNYQLAAIDPTINNKIYDYSPLRKFDTDKVNRWLIWLDSAYGVFINKFYHEYYGGNGTWLLPHKFRIEWIDTFMDAPRLGASKVDITIGLTAAIALTGEAYLEFVGSTAYISGHNDQGQPQRFMAVMPTAPNDPITWRQSLPIQSINGVPNLPELGGDLKLRKEYTTYADYLAGRADVAPGTEIVILGEFKEPYAGYQVNPDYAHTEEVNLLPSTTGILQTWVANRTGYITVACYVSSSSANAHWVITINNKLMWVLGDETKNRKYFQVVLPVTKGDSVEVWAKGVAEPPTTTATHMFFIPPLIAAIPQARVVVQPGSDYSLSEQPVLINDNGVIRQKQDPEGNPIWCRTFTDILSIPANTQSYFQLMTGVKYLWFQSGWWSVGDAVTKLEIPRSTSTHTFLCYLYADTLTVSTISATSRVDAVFYVYVEYTKL